MAGMIDRRAAARARYHEMILRAARDLVTERGGRHFTIDELADRANVARRTVFNHFGTIDEVLLAVCEQELATIVERLLADVNRTPVGDGSRSAMFDELAFAIRRADVAAAVLQMQFVLGEPGTVPTAKATILTQVALSRVGDRLRDEVLRRHTGADPLDAALLVGSLISGVGVIAEQWLATTDPANPDALKAWDELLSTLMSNIRNGYMPMSN